MACPIYTEVAGLTHENRSVHLSTLMLGDQVSLQREPNNVHDPNAIRVVLSTGETIGYIPRGLALQIATLLDKTDKPIPAYIVALEGGQYSVRQGLRIYFELPDVVADFISFGEMDYFFDEHGLFGYLMLNCDDAQYMRIIQRLEARGFECLHHGPSIRVASDGRKYRWFIRIFDPREENGPRQGKPTEKAIDEFFFTEFHIQSEHAHVRELARNLESARRNLEVTQHRLDKAEKEHESILRDLQKAKSDASDYETLVEDLQEQVQELEKHKVILESTVESLKNKRDDEKNAVERLQNELDKLAPSNTISSTRTFREDLKNILCNLFPDVQFLRYSLDEIADMTNYNSVMRMLGELARRPQDFKGERVESTKDWKERRFSDDGRLYYRIRCGIIQVLISNKRNQHRDITYLKTLGE